jgi:hypothetical protein
MDDGNRYVYTFNRDGSVSVEELPPEAPQTAMANVDRTGGVYLSPLNNAPGSDLVTVSIDKIRGIFSSR